MDAVKLVTDQGYKVSEAARNLGINNDLISRWKRELTTDDIQAFPGKGKMPVEKEELLSLRKENKQLKMEKEILKKATAFFARESF
jgi:transposase